MTTDIHTLTVNGVVYIRQADVPAISAPAINAEGLTCVLVRTQSAGVHFGYLKSRTGKEVELLHTRRVFYWDGAASLSQMAVDGVNQPKNCKFSVVVPSITLTEAIEVIPLSVKARENLFAVPDWKR